MNTEKDDGYVCEPCGENIGNIVGILQHGCSPVRLAADSITRRERSTLIYVEGCVVDHGGKLSLARMNMDDYQNLKIFAAAGLLEVGDARPDPDNPGEDIRQVERFSSAAWDLVRDCRKIRAMHDDRVDFDVVIDPEDS